LVLAGCFFAQAALIASMIGPSWTVTSFPGSCGVAVLGGDDDRRRPGEAVLAQLGDHAAELGVDVVQGA
jgi:hypothetical protein